MREDRTSSEADDVGRVARRDQEAFLRLYDRYAPRVFGLLLRMLGDRGTAEDVTQEVFLKLWTRAHQYDPAKGSVAAWLLAVARRSGLDRIRLERRRPPLADSRSNPERPPYDAGADGAEEDRWRALRFAVLDLPRDQRQTIELAFYYGLSQSEIAEILAVPLGTVKTRIRLGMDKLRRAWIGEDSRSVRRSESDAAGVNLG